MEIVVIVLQLILSLSILVVWHELGHFIPAKLFKTRVEKFYLFFNPWFSLFKVNRGGTEYGVGWLPLGGYVKIAGMIDESMDKEQMKKPAEPWEFRAKPAWQRLIIMMGGVTMNVILAVMIYTMLLFFNGQTYLLNKDAKYGIVCDSMALQMGLQNGDKILAIDGKPVDKFSDIAPNMVLSQAKVITVDRKGQSTDIHVADDFYKRLLDSGTKGFIDFAFPAKIDSMLADSKLPAEGVQKGDVIVAIDHKPVYAYFNVALMLQDYKSKQVDFTLLRGQDTITKPIQVSAEGKVGFMTDPEKYLTFTRKSYSLLASVPAGFNKAWTTFTDYLRQFKLIFSSKVKGYKHLGGFGTIAGLFPRHWDWTAFWSLTAFLSIMLAFLNVLPIPALDGGHVMFTLYEMITRRKPNEKFLEYAQIVGMLILLALVLFANGNDVYKKFFK